MDYRFLTLEERFWLAVPDRPVNGCWEWTKSTVASGYGKLRLAKQPGERRGRHTTAHRVSWEIHHGPIPNGLWVLHHCDNPPCVNPNHLYLGTRVDNGNDVRTRKRMPKSRLTHCKNGHEFVPVTTIVRPNGTRACRTCHNTRRRS